MTQILEVINATKRFGGLKANDNINFSVQEGEIVGVVGPNGAGKTTLFNAISGAFQLTEGKITFEGIDITKKKAHQICRMGIGRTFQIPKSLNDMTVFENVLVAALCNGNDFNCASEISNKVLEDFSLSKYREEYASILNVAQKKRLEMARAIATNPKLLLLDETMAGLTQTERKESLDLIREINSSGITVLTIEHNMDVVMNISDRVVVLVSGKVMTIGTPDEVTNNEDVINAYLGRPKHA